MAKESAARAVNFGSILDTPSNAVEKPKPLPQGSYIAVVQGLPRFDKSSKKQTEFVEFTLKLLSAGEDVDAEELAAMGGIAEKTIKATYYLTETALWRLKDFLDHAQIEEGDATLRQRVEAAAGAQVGVFINHEASQDGESVFARVGRTFVAE